MKLNTLILAAGIFIFGTQAAYGLTEYLIQFNSIATTAPAVKGINNYLVNASIKIAGEVSRIQNYLINSANHFGARWPFVSQLNGTIGVNMSALLKRAARLRVNLKPNSKPKVSS